MWVAMLSPSSFRADALGALSEFLEDIEENPALRAASTLRAMDRLGDALLLIEETASVETPGSLLLQDVALGALLPHGLRLAFQPIRRRNCRPSMRLQLGGSRTSAPSRQSTPLPAGKHSAEYCRRSFRHLKSTKIV